MVTSPDLMKSCRYLLELCTEFSDYIIVSSIFFFFYKYFRFIISDTIINIQILN